MFNNIIRQFCAVFSVICSIGDSPVGKTRLGHKFYTGDLDLGGRNDFQATLRRLGWLV